MDTLVSPFEVKSIADSGVIEGLAAGIGNQDSVGDVIAVGAFRKSLAKSSSLPMLLHHDIKRPIGVWTDLSERAEGLYAKGQIVMGAHDGREAHALVKAGALRGLSIGFRIPPGGQTRDHKSGLRMLNEIELMETSLVTIGANPRALVHAVKSIGNVRDIEDMLTDAGMSGRKAKAAAAAAWKSINEAETDEAVSPALAALFKQSAARIAGK